MLERGANTGLITVHEDVSADWLRRSTAQLDIGERSAIALALHLGCPVLMDERLGRQVSQLIFGEK